MNFPKDGTVKVVEAYELETHTAVGWAVLKVLKEERQENCFEQHAMATGPISLSTIKLVKVTRYLIHRVADSLGPQVESLNKRVLDLSTELNQTLELTKKQTSRLESLTDQLINSESLRAQGRDMLKEAEKKLTALENGGLAQARAGHEADLVALIRSVGLDRAMKILGRPLVDPDPTTDEARPTAFERLLGNDVEDTHANN